MDPARWISPLPAMVSDFSGVLSVMGAEIRSGADEEPFRIVRLLERTIGTEITLVAPDDTCVSSVCPLGFAKTNVPEPLAASVRDPTPVTEPLPIDKADEVTVCPIVTSCGEDSAGFRNAEAPDALGNPAPPLQLEALLQEAALDVILVHT